MHILINTVKGKRINVEVEDSSNTIDLKILGDVTSKLVFKMDQGPDKGAVMTIFISTFSGKTIDLEVNEYDTIKEVKFKYWKKAGTPVEQQVMLFNGRSLDDNLTLADYEVEHEETLLMTVPQCGC